jgi:hypothetical protein
MRNPLSLAWWILILAALEISSLILDRSHHLLYGQGGLILLKAAYLGFATVLLVRFLSFRSRKNYESMVDSYNRISGRTWTQTQVSDDWHKFLFHMGLVVVASTNFLTPLAWGDMTFKTSILLDGIFWVMALRWVVRAHWLRALGRKEKLKATLDDARSKLKAQDAGEEPVEKSASAWPFLSMFILAVSVSLFLTYYRFRHADTVFKLSDLKGCLHQCLDRALERFHRDGKLDENLSKEACLARHRDLVDIGMGFQRGELLLWAIEKPGLDYFGNGKGGDQGLMLDAEGRFRNTGGGRR